MGKHLKDNSGRVYGDGKGPGYRNPPGRKWVPGESGNPSGRKSSSTAPPKITLREQVNSDLRQVLSTLVEANGEEMTFQVLLLRNIARQAAANGKLGLKLLEYALGLEGGGPIETVDDISEDERIIFQREERRRRKPSGDRPSDANAGCEGEDPS